jgi:glycine hydroxymethyltransferase
MGTNAARQIRGLIAKHHDFRANSLNMIAAENVSSPSLREIVASDLMHRYGEYEQNDISRRWDEGNLYVIEIEKIVQRLAKRLFDAKYVDLRPISGHTAILSAVSAFAEPGTRVFETASVNGGHEWCSFPRNIRTVNYSTEFFPFDTREWNIDIDAATRRIREVKPSVLILGASFYLFPHPLRELRSVADDVGAVVVCDEAHVLGLIAGKMWPNPLVEGAHVFTGSTHKTFPGPQKGIVMTNRREYADKVANAIYPALLTNHHLMNVAALGYGLAEFLESGEEYAMQTVKNAVAFGEALMEEGFEVVGEHKGFTQSHQILIKTGKHIIGAKAAKLLEAANIIVNKMELQDANGVRTGTSELTRMGLKESDMKEVARFYREILLDKRDPRRVGRHVRILASRFKKLRYGFDSGTNPYIVPW